MADDIRVNSADPMAAVMAWSLDAVVTKTRQGMITGWSPVAVELYGYQAEEIIGRDSAVLLPAGWESEEADLLRRAAAGEQIAPHTTNRVRKDGTIITVCLAMAPVRGPSGEVIGVASTSRLQPAGGVSAAGQVLLEDRERLRAQMEQAQRLEGLGQLAGGVAHDFNNLIAVILNYAEFVGEEIDAAAQHSSGSQWEAVSADVGQIRRAAERAAGLTRQLLSFARREVIQPQVLNVNELVDRHGQHAAPHARRRPGTDHRPGRGSADCAGRSGPVRAVDPQPGRQRPRRDAGRRQPDHHHRQLHGGPGVRRRMVLGPARRLCAASSSPTPAPACRPR